MMSKISLKHGDFKVLIKDVPDKSVDFVLTDPPYEFKHGGVGGGKKELSCRKFKQEIFKNKNLNQEFDADYIMQEIERVCKKVNCVIFGTDVMISKIMDYAIKKKYIYTLTFWHKTNPPPFTNGNYLKDVELAVCIREKKCSFVRRL